MVEETEDSPFWLEALLDELVESSQNADQGILAVGRAALQFAKASAFRFKPTARQKSAAYTPDVAFFVELAREGRVRPVVDSLRVHRYNVLMSHQDNRLAPLDPVVSLLRFPSHEEAILLDLFDLQGRVDARESRLQVFVQVGKLVQARVVIGGTKVVVAFRRLSTDEEMRKNQLWIAKGKYAGTRAEEGTDDLDGAGEALYCELLVLGVAGGVPIGSDAARGRLARALCDLGVTELGVVTSDAGREQVAREGQEEGKR